MQNSIHLRPATSDDHEVICRLCEQLDRHHRVILPNVFQAFDGPARPVDFVRQIIEAPDQEIILAERDGLAVGLLVIKEGARSDAPMYKPYAFAIIDSIVVEETCRRQGIASALYDKAKRWAADRGLQGVELMVWTANTPAVMFYTKMGFRPIVTRMALSLEEALPTPVVDALIEQRARQAVRLLDRHVKVVAAYLFGLQVDGTPDAYSDIDVAVFVTGAETWDIFHRARVNAAIRKEAGNDLELHYFRAEALTNARPASFAAYVIRHGVAIPLEEGPS